MNVNKVILVGRLTRDPEVRNTNSGSTVTSISIATNSFWKDQSGQRQEKTEFHNIVLFGKIGETAGQYLMKGQEAYFEGRLQTRSYTGKDNIERRVTEVVAENMQFGSKPQGAGAGNNNSGYNNNSNSGYSNNQQNSYQQNSFANHANQNNQGNQNQQPPKPQQQAPAEDIPTINLDDEQDEIKIEDVPF